MKRVLFLLLIVAITACSESKKTDKLKTRKEAQKIEAQIKQEVAEIDDAEGTPAERRKALWRRQKNDLDSVLFAVDLWNKAVNGRNSIAIHDCYAEGKIPYYLKEIAAKEIAKNKISWLLNHKSYRQETYRVQVQYPEENDPLIRCFFQKICIEKNKRDTLYAILEMRKFDDDYLIVRETDLKTEVTIALNSKGVDLPQGESHFLEYYWEDTRNDDALAHNFVPYWISVDVNRIGDKVEVNYANYSGRIRIVQYYAVKDVKLENGVLEFRAGMKQNEEQEAEDIKDTYFDYHRFKLTKKGLVLMESKGIYQGYEGIILKKENANSKN